MRLEGFIHNADSVKQTICAWQIILHNKIIPNLIEASKLVILTSHDLNFYTWFLILPKIYGYSILFSQKLFDMD